MFMSVLGSESLIMGKWELAHFLVTTHLFENCMLHSVIP